jgi:type II secretory pathway pseudopilin PulG
LVELIVVIGIMGVLASLLMGGIMVARQAVKKSMTQTLVRNVEVAAKMFENDWGYLPYDRVSLLDLSASISNTSSTTAPIAVCMFLVLTQKKNGPYLEPDVKDLEMSTDSLDPRSHAVLPSFLSSTTDPRSWNSRYGAQAPLLLDAWGTPLRYDRNNPEGAFSFTDAAGTNVSYNLKTVDVYSLGPNGQDDRGAGDDINNW